MLYKHPARVLVAGYAADGIAYKHTSNFGSSTSRPLITNPNLGSKPLPMR